MAHRWWLVAAYASIVLSMAGCSEKKKESGKSGEAIVVKGAVVEKVNAGDVAESIELSGTVRSRISAVVSARIAGTVKQLQVREGDRVKQGQLLVRLDALETTAAADAAKAAVEEAERALQEAQSNRTLAINNYNRYEKLLAQQVVSRQDFEVKQNEKEVAVQSVARAEARLKQARDNARAAGTLAGYTTVTAPISGIVSSRPVDPGSTVFPAQTLMTLEDDQSYRIELSVPESLAGRVRVGTRLKVNVDALHRAADAVVNEVVPTADAASRTYTVKAPLKLAGLRSGMFTSGIVQLESKAKAVLLPRKAVMERGALTSVWVVGADKRAALRLVKPGRIMGERVEILSGLSDGELVVIAGGEKISEGVVVE